MGPDRLRAPLGGEEVRESGGLPVVAGDLNDAAWSRTTRLSREAIEEAISQERL